MLGRGRYKILQADLKQETLNRAASYTLGHHIEPVND